MSPGEFIGSLRCDFCGSELRHGSMFLGRHGHAMCPSPLPALVRPPHFTRRIWGTDMGGDLPTSHLWDSSLLSLGHDKGDG